MTEDPQRQISCSFIAPKPTLLLIFSAAVILERNCPLEMCDSVWCVQLCCDCVHTVQVYKLCTVK